MWSAYCPTTNGHLRVITNRSFVDCTKSTTMTRLSNKRRYMMFVFIVFCSELDFMFTNVCGDSAVVELHYHCHRKAADRVPAIRTDLRCPRNRHKWRTCSVSICCRTRTWECMPNIDQVELAACIDLNWNITMVNAFSFYIVNVRL